jgi:hypothetical protein
MSFKTLADKLAADAEAAKKAAITATVNLWRLRNPRWNYDAAIYELLRFIGTGAVSLANLDTARKNCFENGTVDAKTPETLASEREAAAQQAVEDATNERNSILAEIFANGSDLVGIGNMRWRRSICESLDIAGLRSNLAEVRDARRLASMSVADLKKEIGRNTAQQRISLVQQQDYTADQKATIVAEIRKGDR